MTFAVLPFTGPNADADAGRLVQAAFESTQAQQESRTNWARVAPRALVAQAMATPSSLKQLGQLLDVNFLVRGNVVRSAAGYSLDLSVLDVQTNAARIALHSVRWRAD
jgi:TolB-like protein